MILNTKDSTFAEKLFNKSETSASQSSDSEIINKNRFLEKKPEGSAYFFLLIKNLKPILANIDNLSILLNAKTITEVIQKPNSPNVYVKMSNLEELKQILDQNKLKPYENDNVKLRMFLVPKIPLDLNKRSKILLVTLYNEKIAINVRSIHQAFSIFGPILKIIIFKKKNYQIFIEFWETEDALLFQQTSDSKDFEGLFFMKVQFTQKTQLIVQNNSDLEYDFSRDSAKPISKESLGHCLKQEPFRRMEDCYNEFNMKSLNYLSESPVQVPCFKYNNSQIVFVVKIHSMDPEIKHKHIFNLFSLFGNIDKITIDSKINCGRVYFLSEIDQSTAFHHLNGTKLFRCLLNLELEKEWINNQNNVETDNVVYNRCLLKGGDLYSSKARTINKPSRILYLFNLTRSVGLEVIIELFSHVEPVENIHYVNESRNSALCYFKSSEAAVKILCNFKNIILIDKNLKINFANEFLVRGNQSGEVRKQCYNRVYDAPVVDFNSPINPRFEEVLTFQKKMKNNEFGGNEMFPDEFKNWNPFQ